MEHRYISWRHIARVLRRDARQRLARAFGVDAVGSHQYGRVFFFLRAASRMAHHRSDDISRGMMPTGAAWAAWR